MSDISASTRRLSPRAKIGLGIFARYATIIGLVLMLAIFSILSPAAFPTVNNFVNVLNQASLAMIIAGGLTLAVQVGELGQLLRFGVPQHRVGMPSSSWCMSPLLAIETPTLPTSPRARTWSGS